MHNVRISGTTHTAKAEGTDPAAVTVSQPSSFLDTGVPQEGKGSVNNVNVISEKVQSKSYENMAFEMSQ
jgi:hypothetical protein